MTRPMNLQTLTVGLALALTLLLPTAQAAPLKVAIWNLGWHLDSSLAKTWMAACNRPFALQGDTWRPVTQAGPGTQPGWQLPWGRNAPVEWDIGVLPPCDVFQANRAVVPVTEAAYAQRAARIGTLVRDQIKPDVIAFQEVSGPQSIRELLGKGYEVCGYEGHKVQRVAFAWKSSLGPGNCAVHWPLSLPDRALREQVRPGLTLTLTHEGKTWKFLTVHLKSSCVSPIDERAAEGRGQLDGSEPNCLVLQDQVAPLQAWLKQEAPGADALVFLGDVNRNFSHEAAEAADRPVRVQGRTRNLWRALNDGGTALTLLNPQCEPSADAGGLCSLGKGRLLAREEMGQLRGASALGCRNPLGLDHIALGLGAKSPGGAFKVPLGRLGVTEGGTEPLLALSDHCPLVALVGL